MKLVTAVMSLSQLKQIASKLYVDLVKAVVDVDKKLLVIDAEMHADEEKYLLNNGSKQNSLWGINLYPDKFNSEGFIEFDSMINLRPSHNNPSRGVEDEKIRKQIKAIVRALFKL